MDEATRADMHRWTGCIAGGLTGAEYEHVLTAAGLVDVEIVETHRVHEHASAGTSAGPRLAAASSSVATEPEARLVTSRDGTRIAYRRLGTGPALVALHGALGSWQSWLSVAERLADPSSSCS